MIDKWSNRFLQMATLISTWSKDDTSCVGAVIADTRNRIVSLGYNGPPHGVEDRPVTRNEKLRRTIHAETNAILHANQQLEGCTIYVTHPPCAQCAAKIIQCGIAKVVYYAPGYHFAHRWAEDLASAAAMMQEAGVEFVEVPYVEAS